MYDNIQNRHLTDEDLPLGIKVAELKATLKEAGYKFHAIGTIPAEGTSQWTNDPAVFRIASNEYPPRGRTLTFEEIKVDIERSKRLPNINDHEIQALIAEAAQTAVDVLWTGLLIEDEALDEVLSAKLTETITALLKNEVPALDRKGLKRVVKDWPSDLRWEMISKADGKVLSTRNNKPTEADEVYAGKCNAEWLWRHDVKGNTQ
jgi:hypothetical protein